MYDAFKYIMCVLKGSNRENVDVYLPIIFPQHIMHSDMKECMQQYSMSTGYRDNKYDQHIEFVSAGFISMDMQKCFGESESMSLKSRPEDAEIIRTWNQNHGKVS